MGELAGVPMALLDVNRVSTLKEAISLLSSHPVDAVVLDLDLPDSRGIETVRNIRVNFEDIPIIVLFNDLSEPLLGAVCEEVGEDVFQKDEENHRLFWRAVLQIIKRERAQPVNGFSADAAAHLKPEFLSGISHELRAPIHSIIGFSKLLRDSQVALNASKCQTFADHILNNARHSLHIIDDLMDLFTIDAGKLHLVPELVDIKLLAEETIGDVREFALERDIRIVAKIDESMGAVYLDRGRFKQILSTYLSNAVRSSMQGGEVLVGILAARDRTFRLEVHGDGPSLTGGDLFTQFNLSECLAAHGGTGMGLLLTKRLVEAQGGRVGVESVSGAGTTFFAVLPLGDVAPPAIC